MNDLIARDRRVVWHPYTQHGVEVDPLPVARGDAVFFHDLTLHASCPNPSGRDRWTAIATYRDASQPDASTVWKRSIVLAE